MSEHNNPQSTDRQDDAPQQPTAQHEGADARKEGEEGRGAASEPGNPTPAGTASPQALFDMAPKPKVETKAAPRSPSGPKTPPKTEPTKYPEGYELRYGREKFNLPREMTASEALAWLAEDDFPELKYQAENKVVHDKDKNRLVVTREAQKKGLKA